MRTRQREYSSDQRPSARRRRQRDKEVEQEEKYPDDHSPSTPNHSNSPQNLPPDSTPPTSTIDFKPLTSSTKMFNQNPIDFSLRRLHPNIIDVEMTDSVLETQALQEINRANKKLLININFTHLSKDGSDFIEWKKNTSRAMKALLSIREYWKVLLPLTSYVDHEQDKLAVSIISNTIHKDLKNVADYSDNAYDAMKALQKHFTRGGCTNQFSLFARMVTYNST